MNILVTGANGQLGNEMRIVSRGSQDQYIFTDVNELDITDVSAVEKFVSSNDIKIIINCAAYTNVEKAEDDYNMAELINATAVRNLAIAIKQNEGLLVHVSTDYVFGGTKHNTPYREDDPTCPTGVYGVTKLHGEQAILEVECKYLIIRTAWLYSEFGKNFVKTMLALTSTKPSINVVFDQVGSPTYAYDLAQVIFNIVEHRKYEGNNGIYHYSNEGVCSWFDFAKIIAGYAGHSECDIQPCLSSEFPSKVARPFFSVLNKNKIKNTFDIKIPYWIDSLKHCLSELVKYA